MKLKLFVRTGSSFLTSAVGMLCLAIVSINSTQAQNLIYSQNFDADDSFHWASNSFAAGGPSVSYNGADFNFDYSTVGIPSAPNSTNGTTKGLKLWANLGPGGTTATAFPCGISVSPTNFPITDNFQLRFDMWLNFVKSGVGSTEVGGAGYGTAGTNAQIAGAVVDSTFIGAETDHGNAQDVRVYGSAHPSSYQDSDRVITGDPSSPYVYAGTNRNSANGYYAPIFPTTTPPQAQTNLFPRQTGLTAVVGNMSFRWLDVVLEKVATRITYKINGNLIATADTADAGVQGGPYLLFNMFDVNGGGSTDIDSTNLQFILFDNIRVTNFPNVVSVTSAAPATVTEGSATPAYFVVNRTAAGVPLTVTYTLSGSATNGVDYTNLTGSVTFSQNATTTNVYITPIDDSIPEGTETVVLTVDASTNYFGGGSATIRIIDNDTPQLSIGRLHSLVYERTNDYATFQVTRLGNTNAAAFPVNLAFSGTATYGVDYYTNVALTLPPGVISTNISVYPIVDNTFEGNETIIATLAAANSGEYTINSSSNSATITLVDADYGPETVLFSDDFNSDHSANWAVSFASTNSSFDAFYSFGWNYGAFGIPPAPHSTDLSTIGLFMSVNKDYDGAGTPIAAALNMYPIGQNFSGNFALRFDMYLDMPQGSGAATEYALCGIDHSGNKTNWWRSGGVPANWTFDGIFAAVETDGQSTPNYQFYSGSAPSNNPVALTAGANVGSFPNTFKSPPYTVSGSPASTSTNLPSNAIWSDVELSQVDGVVTLKINKSTILSYTNTTGFNSGNIMLGYEDAFDSTGVAESSVIYDNVRVVALASTAPPQITSITKTGTTVQIDFTASNSDSATAFTLQTSATVTGTFADTAATISQLSPGHFRATTTVSPTATTAFYRVRR